jgi:hypothetical protein
MSRSLRVDPKYIQKVNLALKRNGYPSQRKFAEESEQIKLAHGDSKTILSENIERPAHWM